MLNPSGAKAAYFGVIMRRQVVSNHGIDRARL